MDDPLMDAVKALRRLGMDVNAWSLHELFDLGYAIRRQRRLSQEQREPGMALFDPSAYTADMVERIYPNRSGWKETIGPILEAKAGPHSVDANGAPLEAHG